LDQNSEEYRKAQQELERYTKGLNDVEQKQNSAADSLLNFAKGFIALEAGIEIMQQIAEATIQMFNNIADASFKVQNLSKCFRYVC
jgi:fumarate hydratase class II